MIAITLLTQADCAWCDRAKTLLADFEAEVTEVSLDTAEGHELAARHGLLFAPGLLHDDRLIAYGRISERALRREPARIPNPEIQGVLVMDNLLHLLPVLACPIGMGLMMMRPKQGAQTLSGTDADRRELLRLRRRGSRPAA